MTTWTWDGATIGGAFVNHALSSRIRFSALNRTFFPRFVRPERGFGKMRGQSVTVTRVQQMPRSGRVAETENLPTGDVTIDTVSVTVSDWGVAIPVTEFQRNLTHFNLRNTYQQLLRNNISITMDYGAAEAFKQTVYKFIPTSGGGVFDTDGTPSTTADANLTLDMVRAIKDRAAGTLKIPPMSNGAYVLALSTKAARGIKDDADAATWLAPTSAVAFRRGTVGGDTGVPTGLTPMAQYLGRFEGVDVWELNADGPLVDDPGASTVSGEGLFFGDDAVFMGQVQSPGLRAGLPYDLGRKQDVGWVGTLEFANTWPEASLARTIHITSQ